MEVYFLKKLILHRSDIRGRNESQNIEECSEAKLQTTSTHFAQTLFLQLQLNPSPIPSPFWAQFKSELRPKLGQHGPKSTKPFPFFSFYFFFPPLAVSSYCFSAIPRLHQLLFRAAPFPHANVTAAPAFFLPPASYHLLSCCMFVPHAAHAANLKISFPTQEQTPPAGHDAHAYLQQLPVTWRPPGLALKANEKEEWRGWPFWVDRKRGLLVFLKGRKSKIRVGQ